MRTALKTKHEAACALKDMIDTVREPEAVRVFPHMLSVLLDILRTTEPSFRRDSLEFQLRRVLIEIIHRIPPNDSMRTLANKIITTMLHLVKNDNEETVVICVKVIVDICRSMKGFSDESLAEFSRFFQGLLTNLQSMMAEYLSEESPLVDPNVVFPSTHSFKVVAEATIASVLFSSTFRQVFQVHISDILSRSIDVCLPYS